MKITINDYKKIESGALKGFANIEIILEDIPITITGVKVIKKQDGAHFYAFPDKKIINKEGEEKYISIIGIYNKEAYAKFHQAMNVAFKEFFAKPQPEPQQQKYVSLPSDGLPFTEENVPF